MASTLPRRRSNGRHCIPQEEQDAIFRRLAWDNIRQAPLNVFLLIPRRFLIFLFQLPATGWLPTTKSLFLGGALYALAFIGYCLASPGQKLRCSPCLWLFGFNALFHTLLAAEFRYSHPVQPYIFMLASAGTVLLFDRLMASRAASPDANPARITNSRPASASRHPAAATG